MQRYVVLVGLWPVAALIAWAIINSVRDTRQEKLGLRSLEWPRTSGTVVQTKVVFDHTEVHYTYTVQTKEYAGILKEGLPPALPDRTGNSLKAINSEVAAKVDEYPVGGKLIVSYNPDKPKESTIYCIDPGPHSQNRPDSSVPSFTSLD